MSRSGAEVRFADGTIRYGIYDGTSDVLNPALFDSQAEAWDAARRDGEMWPDPPDVEYLEPAEVWVSYGGGTYWPVLSSKERIHGPLEWTEAESYHHGKPDWVNHPAPSNQEDRG